MTWYYLGTLELTQGKHTVRFSLGGDEPGTKRFATIDCFVLTTANSRPTSNTSRASRPRGWFR